MNNVVQFFTPTQRDTALEQIAQRFYDENRHLSGKELSRKLAVKLMELNDPQIADAVIRYAARVAIDEIAAQDQ